MNNPSPSFGSQNMGETTRAEEASSYVHNPADSGSDDGYPNLPQSSKGVPNEPSNGSTSIANKSEERAQIRILLGTYSDILFLLLPFFVVLVIKLWKSDIRTMLESPEISLASSVIAGLAVVKMILGLVSHETMVQYRERLVFMVSVTTFLLLTPSLLLTAMGYLMDQAPYFVLYLQPVFLIGSIAMYTGTVNAAHKMLRAD